MPGCAGIGCVLVVAIYYYLTSKVTHTHNNTVAEESEPLAYPLCKHTQCLVF